MVVTFNFEIVPKVVCEDFSVLVHLSIIEHYLRNRGIFNDDIMKFEGQLLLKAMIISKLITSIILWAYGN